MIETGLNGSVAIPMIRGESGFQVPKATPARGLEETKNDLIRMAKDRKAGDDGMQRNQVPGVGPNPNMTAKDAGEPRKDIIVPAY